MADIKYNLEFFSYWHCGSGLSEGAGVDLLVIRDSDGLPFIPGKTIKGLVREAVEELNSLHATFVDYSSLFGLEGTEKSVCFFMNAVLEEHDAILANRLTDSLFSGISSTGLDEHGMARNRRIEVVIPCSLEGTVLNVPDEYVEDVKKAFQYIKGVGLHRNRGLGRCRITVMD